MSESGDEIERTRRAELVLSLRSRGIRHLRTLAAIETIPRSAFAPSRLAEHAYSDRALPIACGQTMERPSEIAKAIDALGVGELDTVLEIGSGSGYATAIFAQISRRLFTVERWRTLADNAERRVRALGNADHVVFSVADGLLGLPDQGPFERIFVSAAVEAPPSALLNQLKPGGVMVLAVGPVAGQRLTRITKARDGSLEEFTLGAARLPPAVPGVAAAL
ncbi:protein-L-isoaspartate(D-aspartate) O-methyltransferase [Chenggangzhangella methanolivorans]|uniref:Protein-L-isoaspartate O-methyltransferase n=1 Tax=Chenggangzhangella methanolivorans TaxID=1437009 RepID=A0A9E6UMF5_9HYPH|nr:protein-L-isoaspartate(D-aspartate) O-methyltransferase [Chenggangzhangella methanolivorans]QZN99985.1 protein-L-isoaspartate(D-aspartate) O-methyltransferase [Chenggangzhangella methanolivorans]